MSHDKPSAYLVFGAWVHGGCYGVTKRTQKHPWLCNYVNEFISRSSPKGFTWTAFVFNFNGKARLHTDKYNQRESYNLTFSFGDYTGRGGLWIEGASKSGTPAMFEDDDGKQHKGYDCITYRKPTLLHPSTKHGVQPYTGERRSTKAYSSGGYQKFNDSQKKSLRQSKFQLPPAQLRLPTQSALVCVRSGVCSPLDEGGRVSKPTSCSRLENDSFAHTSIECTNTQQVAGHGQAITASRLCVISAAGSKRFAQRRSTTLGERMATVIVENEFVKVNTSMPDHPGSCAAMKVLLQSAALNCDCLSLGMDHEAEMLAQAHTEYPLSVRNRYPCHMRTPKPRRSCSWQTFLMRDWES